MYFIAYETYFCHKTLKDIKHVSFAIDDHGLFLDSAFVMYLYLVFE